MNIGDILFKANEMMDKNFIRLHSENNVKEAFDRMIEFGKEEVIITDDGDSILGIFTMKDFISVQRDKSILWEECPLRNFEKNVVTIEASMTAHEARDIMIKNKIGRLPVTADNKVVGVVTANIIRDKYYLKLSELFDLQTEIMDNLHESVSTCDENGIVNFWNKSSERLYNVKSQEILGRYVGEIFPNALAIKVLKEGVSIENIYHEPVKGKMVNMSTIPIRNSEGKIIAVVSTDRDVTEVVSLSNQLETEKEKVKLLNEAYQNEVASKYNFYSIIGKNKKIIDAMALMQKIAPTSVSVLITGESGTGKEVFARALHEASGRKGNFVPVNCSAIPYELFESELFGYIEGAFTGAIKKGKIGKFELANNGTIFLDEIGDMPIDMQVKLLRVLQDGVINRLGSEKEVNTNARIIAATNRNLKDFMKEKKFRSDLFYRLAVVQIELPPLRERKEDIRDFINSFIKTISTQESIDITSIDEGIYPILANYKWEGNIRELKNIIQRMVVLSNGSKITVQDIPEYIMESGQVALEEKKEDYDLERTVAEMERKKIKEALKVTMGNKKEAAKLLNIKRSTLYYKINQYGLSDE